MSKKYTSFRKQQRLWESFRQYSNSGSEQTMTEAFLGDPNDRPEWDPTRGKYVYKNTMMTPSEKSRERNFGVEGETSAPGPGQITMSEEEEKDVNKAIDEFLKRINDPEGGLWPQTWTGVGEYYDSSDGTNKKVSDEISKKVRERFDAGRKAAGRNPFTREHLAQDMGSASAFVRDSKGRFVKVKTQDGRQLNIPAVGAWVAAELVKPLAIDLDRKRYDVDQMIRTVLAKGKKAKQVSENSENLEEAEESRNLAQSIADLEDLFVNLDSIIADIKQVPGAPLGTDIAMARGGSEEEVSLQESNKRKITVTLKGNKQ